jgi:hypothetical protein
MTVSELRSCDSIHVNYCGYLPNDFEITNFELAYFKPGIDFGIISNSGLFTSEQKKILDYCEGGEKIYFTNIKIKLKETDSIVSINTFEIIIKAPWSYAAVDLNRPYFISSNNDRVEMFNSVLGIDSIVVADASFLRNRFKDYYQVISFDIYSTPSFFHRIEGNKITPEAKKDIQKLKKYKLNKIHNITINNVKYKDEYGNIQYATPIKFEMTTYTRKQYDRLENYDSKVYFRLFNKKD